MLKIRSECVGEICGINFEQKKEITFQANSYSATCVHSEKIPWVFGVSSVFGNRSSTSFVIKAIICDFIGPNANNPLTRAPHPSFATTQNTDTSRIPPIHLNAVNAFTTTTLAVRIHCVRCALRAVPPSLPCYWWSLLTSLSYQR